MSNSCSEGNQASRFGLPWPDLNEGLTHNDVVRPSDSDLTLIEFYSKKYKNSAPLQGWSQRIENGQITVDGNVVRCPDTILRAGSELAYTGFLGGSPMLRDPLYDVGGIPKCLDCESVDGSFAPDGGFVKPTKPVPGDCGYSLHAHQVTLSHPTTNGVIRIVARLPQNLRTTQEAQKFADS